MFAYSTYPPPPEMMVQPYGAVPGCLPVPTETYPESPSALPVPVMQPPMTHFGDPGPSDLHLNLNWFTS
jgi:hypothetical protein